jgi:hypothetical protein
MFHETECLAPLSLWCRDRGEGRNRQSGASRPMTSNYSCVYIYYHSCMVIQVYIYIYCQLLELSDSMAGISWENSTHNSFEVIMLMFIMV